MTVRDSWCRARGQHPFGARTRRRKVCVQTGTTSEANLADFFVANNMAYEAVVTASRRNRSRPTRTAVAACSPATCRSSTPSASSSKDPEEHVILPDVISKEPLGPAVRQDDPKWALIVKWVHFALLDAEELGVSSKTNDEALASTKPDVQRLVGARASSAKSSGCRTTGRARSCAWSATTARSTSAISAPLRSSAFRAA